MVGADGILLWIIIKRPMINVKRGHNVVNSVLFVRKVRSWTDPYFLQGQMNDVHVYHTKDVSITWYDTIGFRQEQSYHKSYV